MSGYSLTRASVVKSNEAMEAGVIDPTKVTRTALQNAASIASLLLTTEALVSAYPDHEERTPAGPPGGMGGGMY